MIKVLREHTVLMGVVGVAIGLRLWHINWGLPEIYEEAWPLRAAWNFWNWNGNGFDFNPHIFNYPAFTFYCQFLIQVVHFVVGWIAGIYPSLQAFKQAFDTNPAPFVVTARLCSTLFDVGSIVISYALALKIWNRPAARITAALIAINTLHIKQSHLITVDTPLTFWIMASLYCIFQVKVTGSKLWYVLSGVSIGLAASAKYTGALLIPVLLIAHAMRSTSTREAFRSLVSIEVLYGICLPGMVFLLLNPYVLLSFNEFYARFSFLQYNVVTHGHLGVVSTESTPGFYLFQSIPEHLGIPLTVCVLASTGYLLWRRKQEGLLLLAFPLLYLVMISGWEYRAERYLLPLFPCLIVVGSVGCAVAWEKLSKKIRDAFSERETSSKTMLGLSRAGLLALLVIPALFSTYRYQSSYVLPDTRAIAKEWLLKNIPPQSSIATTAFGMDLPNDRYRVIRIPYHPVITEPLAAYYNTELYRDLDVILGSTFDYGRYVLEPEKYKPFILFYDSLKTQCELVKEFAPEGNEHGPTIWIYKPVPSPNVSFEPRELEGLRALAETSLVSSFVENIAFTEFAKGRLEKSEQLLTFALSLDTTNLRVLKALTWTLYNSRKYDDVIFWTSYSLELDANQPQLIALRGSSLLRSDSLDQAEKDLNRALEMNNKIDFAYLDLELLYRRRHDYHKVLDILTRYLRTLSPGSAEALAVERRMAELKGMHGGSGGS